MIIAVKVKPNSSVDKIELKDAVFHVKLKARPINGEANEHLIKYIAHFFCIPKSSVQINKGHTSAFKKVNLDISTAEFELIVCRLENP
ncbi:MAG: DUF167 domain-containing protein [Cytophagales bacterium]